MQRQNGQRQKGSGFVLHRFIKGRCKQGDLEKAPEEVQVRLTSFSVTPEEQYDPRKPQGFMLKYICAAQLERKPAEGHTYYSSETSSFKGVMYIFQQWTR